MSFFLKHGFLLLAMAPVESQKIVVGAFCVNLGEISVSSWRRRTASRTASSTALISDSVGLWLIACCVRLDHEMHESPRKATYPVVGRQSRASRSTVGSLNSSASDARMRLRAACCGSST